MALSEEDRRKLGQALKEIAPVLAEELEADVIVIPPASDAPQ